ncbi:putative adenylyl-sulfate kinase [Fundidesulfovibrio magnetotacticus]|uniref:Adenylyl-sulfate kinase n=1 Tax=Fundidesulfovibrio magnetotacticus TaxID=2730080 RepID=A0A6V8M2Z4_9BACT|nr:adenylyl-sulfate kinase [Fundidesulfovibrio magnetotacticus]GFK94815.1 putative adenylyl-sulfate kinase [Fundidesulfovibrio magnetotacticus]
MDQSNRHVVKHRGSVTPAMREALLGQRGQIFWLTGLSSSGKSTIAHAVEERLHAMGKLCYVFDGDNVRHGLCSDLGFLPEERTENMRRIAEMAKLFMDAGLVCMSAMISPLQADRERVRNIIGPERFHEIYIECPLEVCELRDPKGLYKLAREGKIKNYTGVSAPYEAPAAPALTIHTGNASLEECVDRLHAYVVSKVLPES